MTLLLRVFAAILVVLKFSGDFTRGLSRFIQLIRLEGNGCDNGVASAAVLLAQLGQILALLSLASRDWCPPTPSRAQEIG